MKSTAAMKVSSTHGSLRAPVAEIVGGEARGDADIGRRGIDDDVDLAACRAGRDGVRDEVPEDLRDQPGQQHAQPERR